MEAMWTAFWAWIGWNVLAPFAVLFVILLVYLLFQIQSLIRYLRCKHERWYENRSCDVICKDCGTNLGFIGKLRDENKLH